MYVCTYIGMHVCMYACMYVRLEILIFIYLWYAEVARQAVVADNRLLRILNGLGSRILGSCKHASSSIRRWPDALCTSQESRLRHLVTRKSTTAAKCQWKAFGNVKKKGMFGAFEGRRGGWRKRHLRSYRQRPTALASSRNKPSLWIDR